MASLVTNLCYCCIIYFLWIAALVGLKSRYRAANWMFKLCTVCLFVETKWTAIICKSLQTRNGVDKIPLATGALKLASNQLTPIPDMSSTELNCFYTLLPRLVNYIFLARETTETNSAIQHWCFYNFHCNYLEKSVLNVVSKWMSHDKHRSQMTHAIMTSRWHHPSTSFVCHIHFRNPSLSDT